jgi:hypothetical protein
MAHFAKINKDNIVETVIVIDNKDITINGEESEQTGKDFIANILKLDGVWIQTSYNHNFRGRYAGIGNFYNKSKDIFEDLRPVGEIVPKPDYLK